MSEEEEHIKKYRYVAYEVIDTEKRYLDRLQAVKDVYIIPILDGNIFESKHDFELQFGCWDTILKTSKQFYENLVQQRDSQQPKIAQIFLNMCEDKDFLMYKSYLVNFEIALNRRAALSTTNKKFSTLLTEARNDPKCLNFGIEPLLSEPVSRVPRYKLLLEQLIKYTPADSSEYDALQKCYKKVSEVANENNEAIRARENKEKIMEIQLSIDIKTRINLLDDPSRKFIRSGVLERQCRRTIKDFTFWLFSDKLLYGELLIGMTGNSYNLNRAIPLHECRVTAEARAVSERPECAFTFESPSKSFVAWTKTVEEKKSWIADITAAVSVVRQRLQAETGRIAPVWLPDSAVSQCQDCKLDFTVIRRKHHCRNCGGVLCNDCTKNRFLLRHVDPLPVRVCNSCFGKLKGEEATQLQTGPKPSQTQKSMLVSLAATANAYDLQTFLKHRNAVLDQIDPTRVSALVRQEDDDYSPGDNCCNVCVAEFSMFKTKQTCMNCGSNVCNDCSRKKFLVPHIDPKNEVRVCSNCHIKLVGGLSYESYSASPINRDSVRKSNRYGGASMRLPSNTAPSQSLIGRSISASNNSSPLARNNSTYGQTSSILPQTSQNSKQKAKTTFASYFDIASYVRLRYTVIDEINSKSPSHGCSNNCRSCNNRFNASSNARSECKNCGPNVCMDCTKKEAIVPYISRENKSKVCNKCFVLLSSNSGPELMTLYMQSKESSRTNNSVPSQSPVSSSNPQFIPTPSIRPPTLPVKPAPPPPPLSQRSVSHEPHSSGHPPPPALPTLRQGPQKQVSAPANLTINSTSDNSAIQSSKSPVAPRRSLSFNNRNSLENRNSRGSLTNTTPLVGSSVSSTPAVSQKQNSQSDTSDNRKRTIFSSLFGTRKTTYEAANSTHSSPPMGQTNISRDSKSAPTTSLQISNSHSNSSHNSPVDSIYQENPLRNTSRGSHEERKSLSTNAEYLAPQSQYKVRDSASNYSTINDFDQHSQSQIRKQSLLANEMAMKLKGKNTDSTSSASSSSVPECRTTSSTASVTSPRSNPSSPNSARSDTTDSAGRRSGASTISVEDLSTKQILMMGTPQPPPNRMRATHK